MSEESLKPSREDAKYQRMADLGFEFVKQDEEDPERGPALRQVRTMREAGSDPGYLHFREFVEDLAALKAAYVGHFGSKEAERRRLYHAAFSGSSPFGTADQFDFDGEWSVQKKMLELAKKYHLDVDIQQT